MGTKMVKSITDTRRMLIDVDSKEVKRIRAKLKMSQMEFASLLGVPVRTLQEWEQGRSEPRASGAAILRLADSGVLTKRKR